MFSVASSLATEACASWSRTCDNSLVRCSMLFRSNIFILHQMIPPLYAITDTLSSEVFQWNQWLRTNPRHHQRILGRAVLSFVINGLGKCFKMAAAYTRF